MVECRLNFLDESAASREEEVQNFNTTRYIERVAMMRPINLVQYSAVSTHQLPHKCFRGIIPTKKPPSGRLTLSQEYENCMISSDRITFDKVVGILCGFWTVLPNK